MRFFVSVVILSLFSCGSKLDVSKIQLESLKGNPTHINPTENALSVIFFLSPECPLCINYSVVIEDLNSQFANDSVKFYGVFSQEWYITDEVREYQLKYDLRFEMLFEAQNQLSKMLGATVTPEVFVLNSKSEVVYSGKIDNWVNELGKKKLEVSEHYLENALHAWRDGKTINPKHTEAIGCLIE